MSRIYYLQPFDLLSSTLRIFYGTFSSRRRCSGNAAKHLECAYLNSRRVIHIEAFNLRLERYMMLTHIGSPKLPLIDMASSRYVDGRPFEDPTSLKDDRSA